LAPNNTETKGGYDCPRFEVKIHTAEMFYNGARRWSQGPVVS
jgi:hypothetical protein